METAVTRSSRARRRPAGAPHWLAAAALAATQAGTVLAAAAPPGAPDTAQATAAREAAGPAETRRALFGKLRQRIEAVDARLDGVLGVCVVDLAGGERIELRPDDAFPTASSIKLAILYELYRQAEEGRVDLAEVTRPPAARVRGGGVLQELGERVSLTWRDLAVLMIGWSDNEATNLLIGRVGMDAVNRRLDALSLQHTRLRRQMMDLEAARRGDENVSTPCELARLAALVGRAEGLPPERGRDLLAVATVPDDGSPFRRGLPEGQRAVSKLGSLEGVRCEAAWVDVPGRPYAAAVMTSYLQDGEAGEAAIREISSAIYETFDRLARASAYGRVISPR